MFTNASAITSTTVVGSDSGAFLYRPTSIALFTLHNTFTTSFTDFNEFNNLHNFKFNN